MDDIDMLTIAHISDLHFCEEKIQKALEQFSAGVNEELARRVLAGAVENHFADNEVVFALQSKLQELDPDVIVISGDITAFGDMDSFDKFKKWCHPLLPRQNEKPNRRILVVPGNHDALKHHFTSLVTEKIPAALESARDEIVPKIPYVGKRYPNRFPQKLIDNWGQKRINNFAQKKYIRLLDPLKPYLASDSESDHLAAFRAMVSDNHWLTSNTLNEVIDDSSNVCIRLIPFSTVCDDPLWMNIAQTDNKDWTRFINDVKKPERGAVMKIVVAHHNPVTPLSGTKGRFDYAYNGMPEGTHFLSELQKAGVDLVLHGHQHEHSVLKFDFDHGTAGHAFVLGADCSSGPQGGFNLLTIENPNKVKVQQYCYKRESGFTEHKTLFLPLERNRPTDHETLTVRYELKQYTYPQSQEESDRSEADIFSKVQAGSGDIVYMSGRHFAGIEQGKFRQVRERIEQGCRIRMIFVDPELIEQLTSKLDTTTSTDGDLWGSGEFLGDLGNKAKKSLTSLREFVDTLGHRKNQIHVSVSHTLIPFGATVVEPNKPWGKMAIKLLPIGAMGKIHSPLLRINRREEQALYHYYLTYLKYLFQKSSYVAGDWQDKHDLELDQDVTSKVQ